MVPPWLYINRRRPEGDDIPEWVRDCWIGLPPLALDPFRPFYDEPNVVGIKSREAIPSDGGFCALIKRSLETLEVHHPEAADWWRKENADFIANNQLFIFDPWCGEVVETPFLGYATHRGSPSITELTAMLESCGKTYPWLELTKDKAGRWWPGDEANKLDREYVLRLGEALAHEVRLAIQDFIARVSPPIQRVSQLLAVSNSNPGYRQLVTTGHLTMKMLHQSAERLGLDIKMEEIDQAIDPIDRLVESGSAVRSEDGQVGFTPEWMAFLALMGDPMCTGE